MTSQQLVQERRVAVIPAADKQTLLRESLNRFDTNPNGYYDAEKDRQDIETYYEGIDFVNSDGKTLYQSLKKLLETTHHNRLNYERDSDRLLKAVVDLHPDKTFRSLYSGKEADPVKIIEEEMHRIVEAGADSLTGHSLNIEHVVPQSWFSDRHDPDSEKEPMRGDLHHLYYCEKPCNEFRGNKAYTDFSSFQPESLRTEQIRGECGMGEGDRFEPEYGKGFVARATLYFLLRYPERIETQFRNQIDIELLLRWHAEIPPNTLYEKHRNQSIFTIQRNRNPLIDFPEHTQRIDFKQFLNIRS
ncbi:endonuclease I [Paenibacillus peoriae]|uniref:Endonuclease I n=1 Tax=Paenibacillus peoriae TaxID=59893 RepID=A0ABU1QLH0_9BACL|nr:endonuclease [Paenibacillus peoriae]MDR6780408.1 endonuclease I [Paenibacillus peoriae]